MDDTEIRLHCVEVAEGDLYRARQIYNWVKGRDEPLAGPTRVTQFPIPGSTADVPRPGGVTHV